MLLNLHQTYTKPKPNLNLARQLSSRVIAIVSSSLSVVGGLLAFYFFFRMEKRYRHQLIIINIAGDLIRALSYLIFSSISTFKGYPKNHSALCQTTGWFISFGHEVTDLSVLAIAIHGAMQVYRPTVDTHDPHYGLNPYRHYINTILLVVPLALASLAFINSDEGYTSGGAVCWLPVRPIWYRLGLSWIPRYIIFVVIVVVETAVYMHVRHQMAGFDQAWKNTSKRSLGRMPPTQGRSPPPVVWGDPFSFPKPVEDIVRLPSHDTINKATSQLGQLETEVDRAHSTGMMFGVMDARRETMLKQMRLTFVYPVIYIALWVIPCVLHSMLFSDRFATDPPMVLGSLSILSIASMGFANAICFLIRERPWEEVGLWPRWARRMLAKDMDETNESAPEGFEPAEQDPELLNLQPSFQRRPATLIESIRNSHENSKISEHGVKPFSAKARAKARLALERLDRRRSSRLEQLGGEAVSPSVPQRKPSIAVGERHWWDNYDVSLDEGEESISIQMENTDDMAVERRD